MDFSEKEDVKKLVKQCIKEDRKSQKFLYEHFHGKMLAVCMRYATDYSEAQDILHEGFIKVFVKLKSFKNEGSFEGWIRRIVVNYAIDYIRTKKKLIFDTEDNSIINNIKDDDLLINEEDSSKIKAELIIELIQELTPAYKTVFNLYILEDYSHKQIAEALGISEGTSKSNLAKAKIKLRELFEKHSYKLNE
jgi:RNA polymerase sigma-70 factor (ECF subfamily)